ncbi:hypothetical protein Fot_10988 [Forsythia ovata]|uniref:Uncharacterized protein n=1 Tax=Forsythia ovata TaxID=205694 RepID=A0ABD1WL30_9LAMI
MDQWKNTEAVKPSTPDHGTDEDSHIDPPSLEKPEDMSGRNRGRPRINQPTAPPQEAAEQEQSLTQFATLQQFTTLQDQMSTILTMLQRVTNRPPPVVEILLVEIT